MKPTGLLILLFLGLAFSCYSQTMVTIYADDDYPPYSYEQNGVAKGIYADILRETFNKMPEYRVILQPVPWKRGLKLLETGRGFALYPPYFYQHQRPFISPYSKPILKEEVVVYCHPDSVRGRRTTRWPNDFYQLKFGLNEGFSLGGEAFWSAVDKKEVSLSIVKGHHKNIMRLYQQEIDCYINDRLSILWALSDLVNRGDISASSELILTATVSSEYGYLGFTNQNEQSYPYKEDFVNQFNNALTTMINEGRIEQIVAEYLTR
ncbi:substrate-binding periplasmic protein [Vibrio sonorensis]|uniref:substrate-binding periplasmic protein n=1 Tax=Vibrio sonorensis TaxID=1004316 RepID=UPI000A959A31|nr:transporter substrate-binding domain-containing protein [Vibrio sonorensis]